MNRRKKGIQILKSRIKKANAKLSSHTKPKYISKADRANLTTSAINNDSVVTET
jgi:hypothetical protein